MQGERVSHFLTNLCKCSILLFKPNTIERLCRTLRKFGPNDRFGPLTKYCLNINFGQSLAPNRF